MLVNIMNLYEVPSLEEIKMIAKRAIKRDDQILHDLNYIEAISSLGEEFTAEIIEFVNSSD